MGYKEDNAKKIADAFARATVNIDATIKNAMIGLLDWGVTLCLQEHDTVHQKHLEVGDSYGWLLLHNGVEIQRELYYEDPSAEGNANEALDRAKGRSSTSGWVGIVLAGLKPETYFNVLYEFIPMRAAIRDLKHEDFSKYFKPMKV